MKSLIIFLCLLLFINFVTGNNVPECKEGYNCYRDDDGTVWVYAKEQHWFDHCQYICSQALCGTGDYHNCDTEMTIPRSVDEFSKIATGLGFDCTLGTRWDGLSPPCHISGHKTQSRVCEPDTGTILISREGTTEKTCYFPLEPKFACESVIDTAYSAVCPCKPKPLEEACHWKNPPYRPESPKFPDPNIQHKGCMDRINYYRKLACDLGWPECPPCGLPPMTECIDCHECANSESEFDIAIAKKAHASFRRCGGFAQGQGGGRFCGDVITSYVDHERIVWPDTELGKQGIKECRGHCGPILSFGCQMFTWGKYTTNDDPDDPTGFYTLDWDECDADTCKKYCDDPTDNACFRHEQSPPKFDPSEYPAVPPPPVYDDFKLVGKTPYVNGQPICGHKFDENQDGAQGFCHKLGFETGFLTKIGEAYQEDAVYIGKCEKSEDFPDKCDNHRIVRCQAGIRMSVEIECRNNLDVPETKYELIDKVPHINGVPICGHFFWNDDNGATGFCQKLNFSKGKATRVYNQYKEDSMWIGACDAVEDFPNCNTENPANCKAGEHVGIQVKCSEPTADWVDPYTPYELRDNVPYMKGQPICGHFFWDNNNGADGFCKKMGKTNGRLSMTWEAYDQDAMPVGRCESVDDFPLCEGTDKNCQAGEGVGIKIYCSDGDPNKEFAEENGCTKIEGQKLDKLDCCGTVRSRQGSAEDCLQRCLDTKGCVASTWWHDGGCHLAAHGAKLEPLSGVTSYTCVVELPEKCIADEDELAQRWYPDSVNLDCRKMQDYYSVCTNESDRNHVDVMNRCPATCAFARDECDSDASENTESETDDSDKNTNDSKPDDSVDLSDDAEDTSGCIKQEGQKYDRIDCCGEGRSVTSTPEECRDRCSNTNGCVASSWWHNGGCHLVGTGANLVPDSGVTTYTCGASDLDDDTGGDSTDNTDDKGGESAVCKDGEVDDAEKCAPRTCVGGEWITNQVACPLGCPSGLIFGDKKPEDCCAPCIECNNDDEDKTDKCNPKICVNEKWVTDPILCAQGCPAGQVLGQKKYGDCCAPCVECSNGQKDETDKCNPKNCVNEKWVIDPVVCPTSCADGQVLGVKNVGECCAPCVECSNGQKDETDKCNPKNCVNEKWVVDPVVCPTSCASGQVLDTKKDGECCALCVPKPAVVEEEEEKEELAPQTQYWVEDGCQKRGKKIVGQFHDSLTWTDSTGVRCCKGNDSGPTTCTTEMHCKVANKVSYTTAKSTCENAGGRLCTKEELISDICCGTGGNCDSHPMWSSTQQSSSSTQQSRYELKGKIPYVDNQPICGHWFWNNNNGATGFCQELGYESGVVIHKRTPYDEDAIFIGECQTPEQFPDCGSNTISCAKGKPVGVEVECSGALDREEIAVSTVEDNLRTDWISASVFLCIGFLGLAFHQYKFNNKNPEKMPLLAEETHL